MFHHNIPSLFFTASPGELRGTTVYGVHRGGLLVAETDSNELKVRPGKNLYFIREKDVPVFRLLPAPAVSFIDGLYFIYRPGSTAIPLSLTADALHTIPVHIQLRHDGYYAGDEQCGQPVTLAFNGLCRTLGNVFALDQVLLAICLHWYDMEYGNYRIDTGKPVQVLPF
jgi:hypothetical protein